MSTTPRIGAVGWVDLTVDDAPRVRAFYENVVGWQSTPVPMGDYDDFNLTDPEDGTPRAGVCHRRGGNAELPPCWMVYFTVQDLDASLTRCRAAGGRVLAGPRGAAGRFAVIADPAGAVCALYETAAEQ